MNAKSWLEVGCLYPKKDLGRVDMTVLAIGNISVKLLHLAERIRERHKAASLELMRDKSLHEEMLQRLQISP